MNSNSFENFSREEAELFLHNFLIEERKGLESMIPQIELTGKVKVDYSIDSIEPMLNWVLDKLEVVSKEDDLSVPEWIRITETYRKFNFSFTGSSKILILRSAYYLGQCFVKNHKKLNWAVGNDETFVKNMPVVSGFKKGLEMAPMMICDNLFGRIIGTGDKSSTFQNAISYWVKAVK